MNLVLKPQQVSIDTLAEKYAKGSETTEQELFDRVANGLAQAEKDPEKWAPLFAQNFGEGFIGAGRIMSSCGTDVGATLLNCFVQPVGDSSTLQSENGKPSIYQALLESAETLRRGGGVGYDFSDIRPMGAKVKGTNSQASGPVSYMHVFDQSCATVESAGARRGAQMGVLRADHPDIETFLHAKDEAGKLTNFNISIAVTDDFMEAVKNDEMWDLVHVAEPSDELIEAGAYRRDDGMWVYRKVSAVMLYDEMMRSTYDHAEPGILFVDRMNAENNLYYAEKLEATNPCAEQPLPSYGCCCLGSVNLTRFIRNPFQKDAYFDFADYGNVVQLAIRMLDNVLDVSMWPLEQQRQEAASKRRVGLGFTGLGDALIMMGLRYDSGEGLQFASQISEELRNNAYRSSIELAKEKGAFPLFDADKYLDGAFIKRLPEDLRKDIKKYGIRNSHLTSIAPTGTISLAFAGNASNGIEPAFSWSYKRKKRNQDGSHTHYDVEDHAFRVYREMGGDVENLPESFVNALEISAQDHMAMLEAVQPYIDTSISKTVNIPADYPFEDFSSLYMAGWKAGLKGLATFRPNNVTGSVLSVEDTANNAPQDLDEDDPDRRISLEKVPQIPLASLRWVKRPCPAGGNPSMTYMVKTGTGSFALFVGHIENGKKKPFEVWVNGAEQPRFLGSLAKSLSMDMRSNDKVWLKTKLESLSRLSSDDGFVMAMPDGSEQMMPSVVSAFARLIDHRVEELGAYNDDGETLLMNSLMSSKEPKTGPDGTMSWTVDVMNHATGDDFLLGLKELVLPNGQRRPYSVWLSGEYPKVLDGLCKSLSFDMRVYDPAWVGAKLRQLLDYPEALGDFMAKTPGSKKQRNYPSTVAYMATLIIHRFAMLGLLDDEGYPVEDHGAFTMLEEDTEHVIPFPSQAKSGTVGAMEVTPGRRCEECGNHAVIKRDGCNFCTACGAQGACG